MLLVRRGDPPYEDAWALPGGFVEYGEHVEEACLRELQEETGLEGEIHRLVNVYSDPDRDPRGHVVSAVYKVLPRGGEPEAADDAAEARYLPLADLPEMAFDHGIILMDFMDEYGVDASTFAKD